MPAARMCHAMRDITKEISQKKSNGKGFIASESREAQ